MQTLTLFFLSFGHAVIDLTQGGLPFLLPYFKEAFSLSYTSVGIIVLVSNLSSSIIQPLFGYLSDRFYLRWLLPTGCLLVAVGMGLTGLSPSYHVLLPLVFISGLGSAAYHPEASKAARWASGHRKATSMGFFSVGGNLGYALGPILAAFLCARAGGSMVGSLGLLIPGTAMCFILWFFMARTKILVDVKAVGAPSQSEQITKTAVDVGPAAVSPVAISDYQSLSKRDSRSITNSLFPMVVLLGIIVLRTWVQAGITNYIPLYYRSQSSILLTVFLFSGVIGTVIGSAAADKWGLQATLVVSLTCLVPLTYLFSHSQGLLLYAVVAASGFMVFSTFATTVVMGQELMPNSIGLASGLVYGFAIGTGGLGVTILGVVSDHWGVPVALSLLAILPALSVVFSFFLPKSANTRQGSPG